MNTSAMKSKIKWNLTQLSPEEVEEVNNLVQSLLEQKKRKIVNLEGIWEGIGFEKILDLEREIKKSVRNWLNRYVAEFAKIRF